jgi:hypothetical protein
MFSRLLENGALIQVHRGAQFAMRAKELERSVSFPTAEK